MTIRRTPNSDLVGLEAAFFVPAATKPAQALNVLLCRYCRTCKRYDNYDRNDGARDGHADPLLARHPAARA